MKHELIHDWNTYTGAEIPTERHVTLNDETLRDGLQNPSVHDPSIAEKIEILHLMESLGIETVNIGLPGAGPRAYSDTEALAREIVNAKMKIRPNCAARTHKNDIKPIIEISERVGMPIEAATFIGSSPIRRLVEDWTVDHLQRTTEEAVKFAAAAGLPVMYVTEDTDSHRPLHRDHFIFHSHTFRRPRHRSMRHSRPRHSSRRIQSRKFRNPGSRETIGRKNPRGLARPQ